jgi:hypothetical protein
MISFFKRKLNIVLCVFFFTLPFKSLAELYSAAVQVETTNNVMTVTQTLYDWYEGINTPNPCYGANECWIGPDIIYPTHQPSLAGSCNNEGNCIEISKIPTALEVRDEFQRKFGIPSTFSYRTTDLSGECVGLFYIRHKPAHGLYDSFLWPNSICGKLPPPSQECDLKVPAEIDFGKLNSSEINGRMEVVQAQVSCRLPGSIEVSYRSQSGDKEIYFDDNKYFNSVLSFNNQPAGNSLLVDVPGDFQSIDFNITALLNSVGVVSPGDYSGHAVLFIGYL